MANLFSVKDKVVVITGGTGVLGKTIAVHLAEEGAKVVILGRKAEVGNEIVKTICAKGGEALFLATNVLDRNILEQNLADILKAYGRVDALLNAAGGNMPGATIAPASDIFDLKIDDRAEKRSYCQFLLNGSFPSFDTCGRLFGFQSRHFQLYRIYGHRNCQKVW